MGRYKDAAGLAGRGATPLTDCCSSRSSCSLDKVQRNPGFFPQVIDSKFDGEANPGFRCAAPRLPEGCGELLHSLGSLTFNDIAPYTP